MLNLGSSRHRARKVHYCEHCTRKIFVGEAYHRARIVDGGDAWVWKSHEDCQKASEILWSQGIEGDDACLFKVIDMDRDERDLVRRADPALALRLWPEFLPT